MGTLIFAIILACIVVACCLYAFKHNKQEEEIEEEPIQETKEEKPSGPARDAKGRFVKKTDSQ